METFREPDTTSQTGRQMNRYTRRQMNWRQPKSRTPPARLGDKMNRYMGRQMNSGHRERCHHKPDWETNEWLQGETNELETCREPDTTSQTGRQMNCYKERQMNWRHPESRTPPASQTGRQMNCYKGRQMNWRHAESRTPPARLGDKRIAIRGDE